MQHFTRHPGVEPRAYPRILRVQLRSMFDASQDGHRRPCGRPCDHPPRPDTMPWAGPTWVGNGGAKIPINSDSGPNISSPQFLILHPTLQSAWRMKQHPIHRINLPNPFFASTYPHKERVWSVYAGAIWTKFGRSLRLIAVSWRHCDEAFCGASGMDRRPFANDGRPSDSSRLGTYRTPATPAAVR